MLATETSLLRLTLLSATHRKHTELQSTTKRAIVEIIQFKFLTAVKYRVMVYWVTIYEYSTLQSKAL